MSDPKQTDVGSGDLSPGPATGANRPDRTAVDRPRRHPDRSWPEEDGHYYEDEAPCIECDGEGEILWCIDDICHGLGFCIHGDGMRICPECHGEGFVVLRPAESGGEAGAGPGDSEMNDRPVE